GHPVEDFYHFLQISVGKKPSVMINNYTGDLKGMTLKNVTFEYNLSSMRKLTEDWDDRRDGSCHSCHNHKHVQKEDEVRHSC
ncbi:MAG: hypothetical protein JSV92_04345, partial [archaeon]